MTTGILYIISFIAIVSGFLLAIGHDAYATDGLNFLRKLSGNLLLCVGVALAVYLVPTQ